MTPLTREERDAVLQAHPAAEPGAIEAGLNEYEARVAARFATDPSRRPPPESTSPPGARLFAVGSSPEDSNEARLAVLHQELFG